MYVFLYDIPWPTAQAESFALANCMEPVTPVFAEFASGFDFDDRSGLFSEMPSDEIVVIYFTEKTDSLAVFAECIWHPGVSSYSADFGFRQSAERECQVAKLVI